MISMVWRWQYLKAVLFGKKATITKETATSAQLKSNYDNSKLLKVLSNFNYTPIEDSIRRIAVSFLP